MPFQLQSFLHAVEEIVEQRVKKLCDICDEISHDLLQEILRLRRHLAAVGITTKQSTCSRLIFLSFSLNGISLNLFLTLPRV